MQFKIGLALSGGGARAIAFHLGCLRALEDLGLLSKVSVLSSVSGGSVIAALYAYNDESFAEFENRVQTLLRKGLVGGIAQQSLFSPETPKIVAAQLTSGICAAVGCLVRLGGNALALAGVDRNSIGQFTKPFQAPFPRFASRSTAFERHLRKHVFGELTVNQVARKRLHVVFNAAELITGTAFRFGSRETGTWRYGLLTGAPPHVSKAVSASACFPFLLPSFDEYMEFEKHGQKTRRRVMLTDGGIYDNLGITCLLPGRSAEFSTNVSEVDYIIACDAGQGMPSGLSRPYHWPSRMLMTVNTIHRRTHSLSYELLHRMKDTGQIKGFLLPYLGQIDERLPYITDDLVRRHETFDYPTDFSPMKKIDVERIGLRGEQLTRLLFDHYQFSL
ncbi:NTE family protein [Desulfomicrobium norvegicum]|uniref:NTE family protein n=1 Tax=Desulfomicrobium norvegicum (strain DSM 1741 / NCIMB 8310) TaxID=52561 RepID=A0A8G2FG41_DESNO|nr:patatin-like phospholipase family protein [Desulfomicrobium norvegicum]SFM22009.1 NTE family protein [Desulfomicrobium norvegicum]